MLIEKKKPLLGDVLIADADPAICENMQYYCKNMGCFRNILIANDGSNASNKMRNQKFALIILDLQLPKKAGLDLIRELDDKSTNRKSSVIVTLTTLDKTMLEKIFALGVKLVLPKPFDEASFQEKVLKLLSSK